ncbi:hypothetical protein Tco_0410096 [Tanacetum coccineum]
MKKRRIGKDDEHSKKSSKSKEYAKGKTPSNTSKTGKSVSAGKSVHEPEHIVQIDVEELNLENVPKSCVKLEYNMEECYYALTDQLDWTNPEGHKIPIDMSKPLPLQDKEGRLTIPVEFFFNNDLEYLKARNKERTYSSSITKTPATRAMINKVSKHEVFSTLRILSGVSVQVEKKSSYGYLKEIVIRRAYQKLYKFKEGVESYQRKLNLTKPQRTCPHILVKEPYTPKFDPPGVIYEDKSKKKRLMRVDEIHKFCNGTLQSVRNILRERLLNFKFGYNKDMPLREWIAKDKRRTGIMLNKIDD